MVLGSAGDRPSVCHVSMRMTESYYRKQECGGGPLRTAVSAQIRPVSGRLDRYEAVFMRYCECLQPDWLDRGTVSAPGRPQTECIRNRYALSKSGLNGYLAADSVYGQNSAMESISGLLPEFYNTRQPLLSVQRSHGSG